MKQRLRSDRGATAVLIAFSIVGLLAFGGLVIDGGDAFAQRRQMQNAADSSATAGANALYRYKLQEPGWSTTAIYDDALAEAQANGAKPGTFQCTLVLHSPSGTAPCQNPTMATLDRAWDVKVNVDSDNSTQLIRVVGIESFNARANATASLRAARPVRGTGPFAICANATSPDATGSTLYPLLVPDATDSTGFAVNVGQGAYASAVGREYDIWGGISGPQLCGLHGSSFNGLVDPGSFPIPGWWSVDPGTKAGNQTSPLVGGCLAGEKIKDIPVGCQFAIPLCVGGNGQGGNNAALYCVKYGRFQVTKNDPTGQQDMEGEFLGGGLLTGGEAGDIPSLGDAMIIKLTE